MNENKQMTKQLEDDVTYHAVEKDGEITAIWQMKGKKHLRTIDPKSEEGRRILDAYKPTEASTA